MEFPRQVDVGKTKTMKSTQCVNRHGRASFCQQRLGAPKRKLVRTLVGR